MNNEPRTVLNAPTLCSRCQIFAVRTTTISAQNDTETPTSPTYSERYDAANGLRLLPDVWGESHSYELQDTYSEFPTLNASIEAGCRACAYVKTALARETGHLIEKGRLQIQSPCTWMATGARIVGQHSPTIYLQFEVREDESCAVELRFVMRQRRRRLQVSSLRKDPSDLDALSARDISNMRQWISDCDSHGGPCSAMITTFRPTRLLEVSADSIRLIETENYSPLTRNHWRYMALSYCWGAPDKVFLKTTLANIRQHSMEIPGNDLPKAFRDLARLARALDIPYMWIDALCIVQDDEADWLTQSSLMTEIYSNAHLTVVPLTLSSPHESFIESRLEASIPVPFESRNHAEFQQGCYLRWSQSTSQRPLLSDVRGSTWQKRGWTLQEALSARRILYFGQLNYYLHCGARVIFEGGEFPPLESWYLGNMSTLSIAEIYDRWLNTIEDYTSRKLTFATDKLQAVASLASLVQQSLDDHYIAGSWSKDVPYGLLWRRKDDVLVKSSEYIAPTWCWSTYTGGIYWPLASDPEWLYEMQCSDFDLTVKHRQHDPFGPVEGCQLKTTGKIVKVHFGSGDASCRIAVCTGSDTEIAGIIWDTFDHESRSDRRDLSDMTDAWLLLVCQKRESSDIAITSHCGLVLRRLEHAEMLSEYPRFERIGYFDTNPLAIPLHQAYNYENGSTLGDLRKSCDSVFAGTPTQRFCLL